MRRVIYAYLGFILLWSTGCSRTTWKVVDINGSEYVSVESFGAKGNNRNDDRLAIQRAFESGKDIYFPSGDYLLASKTAQNALLRITENNYPSKIYFDDNAKIVVSSRQPTDYIKPAVIGIYTLKGDIKSIEIDGLTIDGNRDSHSIKNGGLVAYEKRGTAIHNLILKNITIVDVGYGGIHTQARYNQFTNIYTENCGSHGIGIINTTNKGVTNEFYLDGYTSIDDDAYSIDFSGPKDPENRGYVFPGYDWKGSAKNIVSRGSYYGIKTAGYWDLLLENVVIEDSEHNGFFINTDAPGKTLTLKNVTIRNAAGNGMSLAGETNVIGEDIIIEGGRVCMQIKKSKVKMKNLTLDGKNQNIGCLRMGTFGIDLENFTIKNCGKEDQYPVWIAGNKVIMKNGKFVNNYSTTEIIVNKTANQVFLDDLKFLDSSKRGNTKSATILNIQTQGQTIIENCEFANNQNKVLADRVKRTVLKNNKSN